MVRPADEPIYEEDYAIPEEPSPGRSPVPEVWEIPTGYRISWANPHYALIIEEIETRGEYGMTAWVTFEAGELKVPMGRCNLTDPLSLSKKLTFQNDELFWQDCCRWALEMLRTFRNSRVGNFVEFIAYAPTEESKMLLPPYVQDKQNTLIFGDGGNGKSLVALKWGIDVALNQGPVLYLDWETDEYTVWRRLFWMLNGSGDPMPDNLFYLRCDAPIARSLPTIKRHVDQVKPVLVIIDSAGMASGKPSDDESVITHYASMRSFNAATLQVAHISKGNREEPYGSVYFKNYSRLCLRIEGERDESGILVAVTDTKGNNSGFLPPSAMRFTFDEEAESIMVSRDNPQLVEAVHNRRNLGDQIWDVLEQAKTVPEISRIIDKPQNSIRSTLSRNKSRFAKLAGDRWGRLYSEDF